MFTWSPSAEQQRQLAERLTTFLSPYGYLTDSYIIEFFSKDHWHSLPTRWQSVLQDLTSQQVADLLLDRGHGDRRYPSPWPLSLLAFRATAHALAFPRERRPQRGGGGGSLPADEFLDNQSQSSLLGHIFRKHVKPKKQHEIRKLGSLVKQLCDQTDCSTVVDVGSGQGHLTRFLSFGLGLSVTAIEADHALVATASKFDGQLLCALEKEGQKENCSSLVPVSHSPPRHVVGWVNPNASWEAFIEQLSAAQLVNESPPTPSGPSKKSPRGSEQVQPPGSHAVETSSRPGSTEPESTEPGSTEPESTEPGSTEPESTEPKSTEPGSTEPESTEPESTEPESTEPGSTEPKSTEPGSTEHESTEPGSTEPESTEPESTSRRQLTKNEPEEASPDFVLTGLHACGDLSATLLRHFVNCPHVRGITSVACCYMKTTTKENPDPPGLADRDADPSEFGYPMSSWVGGLPGHRLSYKAREGACHAVEDYARRLREGSEALRTHCYRAALETFIADARPDLRRAGIQTIKKAHLLPFTEYARLGLARVGLPPGLPLDPEQVEAMLKQQNRVVVYFSLALLLAPAVETLVLLDRMIYLRENGVDSQLVPLFDPNVSPRNFVLVALKPRLL